MRSKGAAIHNDTARPPAAEYAATDGGVHGVGGVQKAAVDIHHPVEFHLAAIRCSDRYYSIIDREGGAVDSENASGKYREVGDDVQGALCRDIAKRQRVSCAAGSGESEVGDGHGVAESGRSGINADSLGAGIGDVHGVKDIGSAS